ncbi:uncharacterized protein LOC144167037 [Haemaphysalis longicornis]
MGRVFVLSAAVSCSVALAAWALYRKMAPAMRRFPEMRADQTDSIVPDFTEPLLSTPGAVDGAGISAPARNVTEDDLHILGAWRKAVQRF